MAQRLERPQQQDARTTVTYSAVPATGRWVAVTAALTGAGIAGRWAFQHLPSVEPVLAIAIAVAFFGGWRYGAMSGASAFVLSNFVVWGWQGPWTILQAAGAAGAAVAAYGFSRLDTGPRGFFAALIGGTVGYELVMNVGSLMYTPWAWASLPIYFAAAVPFGAVHLASTLGFGAILYGCHDWLTRAYADKLGVSIVRRSTDQPDSLQHYADHRPEDRLSQ